MAIVAIVFNPGSVEQSLGDATSFCHHAALRFIRAWAALSLGMQMEMLDTVVMLYDGRGQSHPKVLEHHSMSLFYVWCVCMCVCVCCAEQ